MPPTITGPQVPDSITRLHGAIGRERALREITQTLYFDVRNRQATLVGALHVTCADEAEAECADMFQQGFAQYLLPPLKFARRSAFRISNLGGRYEWGAIRQADAHFALPAGDPARSKLMVVKINAHVAFEPVPGAAHQSDGVEDFRMGVWERYGRESPCCSALHSLLQGGHEPWVDELREPLQSEGADRLAALNDAQTVDPRYTALYTAILTSRLQARKAVLDIQDYTTEDPTSFLVLPCVTINRHERDTEILCGVYAIDGPAGSRHVSYVGLGDDPARFRTHLANRQFQVTDEEIGITRAGRDHRALARAEWRARAVARPRHHRDERLERIGQDVDRNAHRHHHHARMLLRMALPILAEVMPVPVAVLLFAEGAAGIHHAFRVQRLAREMAGTDEARKILAEVHDRIDALEGDRAEALLELLMAEYRR